MKKNEEQMPNQLNGNAHQRRKEWMEIFSTKPAGQAAALVAVQTFVGSA